MSKKCYKNGTKHDNVMIKGALHHNNDTEALALPSISNLVSHILYCTVDC